MIVWPLFLAGQLFIGTAIAHPLILFFANSLLTALLCLYLYKAKLNQVLFLSFATCSAGMISEIIVALTLQSFGHSPEERVIVGAIVSKLILLFLVHTITIFQYRHSHNCHSFGYWILLLSITIASIICIYILFFFIQINESAHIKNLSLICIFLLFFINLSFFVFNNKLEHATNVEIENLAISQQIKHYEELRSSRENHIQLFNQEKHNLKNQLLALRAYAKIEDTSSVITFINKLLDDPDFGLTPFSASNNIIFDTIICGKITQANKHNISYTWNINVPPDLPFDDIDLCILLGNAIDNAFDACINNVSTDRYIHIEAQYRHGCLYLSLENSFSHTLQPSTAKNIFQTTKSDSKSHGFGLPSLQSIVNKYDGSLSLTPDGSVFTLKIILYQK